MAQLPVGGVHVLESMITKAVSTNGKHRVLGSIAYVGACRANHLFVADPHDPTVRRVLMVDNGGNVAPPAPALSYSIEDRGGGPRVEWSQEPAEVPGDEGLKPRAGPIDQARVATGPYECDEWLGEFLAEGDRLTIDVFNAATAAGFSKDQVRRAKYRLGAVARKDSATKNARWRWVLAPMHPSTDVIRRLHGEP